MALEMTYYLEGVDGLEITNAYLRISGFEIEFNPSIAALLTSKGKGNGTKYFIRNLMLEVKKAKPKNTIARFGGFELAYDHTINASPIKQAYDYLKTLPEFTSSVDITD